MIQGTVSPHAMEFNMLFHFEKTNSLTQISWCFQRSTLLTSLKRPPWKLYFQITDYLNLFTNFKLHSSRLKLRCSWILVHLLPFMQLTTFFLLGFARQMKAICWCSVSEHRLGMTTPLSSGCALNALIAMFLSAPSRNGSCCNRTALCPLFRDVNCVEYEVYYVKLLTVIHQVNKRLTKICGLYILYGDGS